FCARILATTSVPPPAEKPTSILRGLSGYVGVCALLVPIAMHSASARTSMRSIFMAVPRDQPHFDLRRRDDLSARLARSHRSIPPRRAAGGAVVFAAHHMGGRAPAGLGDADADVARLLAAFGREPGAVVAPQARALGTLVRRPVVDVDRAAAPAVLEQE